MHYLTSPLVTFASVALSSSYTTIIVATTDICIRITYCIIALASRSSSSSGCCSDSGCISRRFWTWRSRWLHSCGAGVTVVSVKEVIFRIIFFVTIHLVGCLHTHRLSLRKLCHTAILGVFKSRIERNNIRIQQIAW